MRTPWAIREEVEKFSDALRKTNHSTTSVAFTVSGDEMKALVEHHRDPRAASFFPVTSLILHGILLVTLDREGESR